MHYTRILFIILIVSFNIAHAAATEQQIVPHLEKYTNNPYHFTIVYPSDFTTSKTFSTAYLLRTTWSMLNDTLTHNNHEQHSIFEIQLQNIKGKSAKLGSYYYQAYVRIGLSTDHTDLINCDNTNSSSNKNKNDILINDRIFSVAESSDTAMSQFNHVTSYSYLSGTECYRIEYITTGTNSLSIPNYTDVTNRNENAANNIIQSFTIL